MIKTELQRILSHNRNRRIFVMYGLIGLSGLLLDLVIFWMLYTGGMNPALATCISTACGITNNFIWNARYNFKKRDHAGTRFVLFFSVGVAGIFLSALVLLLFSGIFAYDAGLVKIFSIPPVVLGQFFLNKRFSFADKVPSMQQIIGYLWRQRYLALILLVFLLLSMAAVRFIPLTSGGAGAPDEYMHFGKNVQFILQNHRLPVSGQDDIDSLSTCRDNQFGQVPCLYSYQFTPAFNYVISAVAAKAGLAFGLSELTGARLASTAWGILFVVGVYATARLFLRGRAALLLTATVAFIPQVIFIASYVNQDIHSLAIATWLVFASLAYLYKGDERVRWLFYATFGLLFVAKYNYFIIALVPLALILRQAWQSRAYRKAARDIAFMVAAAAVLSGFWYARNIMLYQDPLGQGFALQAMTQFHPLGHKLSLFDISSYQYLLLFDSFNVLFKSFFAAFGYMNIWLADAVYVLLQTALAGGAVLLWLCGNKQARAAIMLAGLFCLLAFGQVLFNAFTYDYQFQGRYMFAVIPVVFAAVAFGVAALVRYKPLLAQGVLISGFAVMLVVLINAVLVMGRNLASGI